MGWQKITQSEDLSQEAIKARKIERLRSTPHAQMNEFDLTDHIHYDHPTLVEDNLMDMHINDLDRLIREFKDPNNEQYRGAIKGAIGRLVTLHGRAIDDAHASAHGTDSNHSHPQ